MGDLQGHVRMDAGVSNFLAHLGEKCLDPLRGPVQSSREDGHCQGLQDGLPVVGHHVTDPLRPLAWVASVGRRGIPDLGDAGKASLPEQRLVLVGVEKGASQPFEACLHTLV
jgi:hypothetical protein